MLPLILARLSDPILLAPLLLAWWLWLGPRGPGLVGALLRVAAVALVAEIVVEIILHSHQPARTGRDSALAVAVTLGAALAASALLYGLLRLFRR